LKDVLRRLLIGELNLEEAESELRRTQLMELAGRARLDLGRPGRRGLPEVVLANGKTPVEVAHILLALAVEQGQGLASRLGEEHWLELERSCGQMTILRYGQGARLVREGFAPEPVPGRVGLLTAGTSDSIAVEEARMMVEACGLQARVELDVGVAGLHRLLVPLTEILAWDADVLVVAAGMDGVLPGVVAGLVDLPVIGLPVSTGYGAGGKGEAALLTMLQSCSTGLTLVNIDNGVGAGAAAALIACRAARWNRRRPRPAPRGRPGRSTG
jgi:pyridinium-3,5-biscarboxylic acid mononucleotide synthase